MDWKACAVDDLRKYNYIKIGIANSTEKLRCIEAQAEHGKLNSGKYSSSPDSRLINALVESERLRNNILLSKNLAKMIERGLDALSDDERYVLREFYMQEADVNMIKLKERLGYEMRSVYRLRDRALEKFTLAMYGVQNL
ncbi:MAG: hypothetical protein IJO61_00410 [Oscillospiraceae bacterium]|nr:hypothetical protein [Oscillospiraceae bacterium]MBQ6845568.1 hypothetical protein [Oscillospiraceae bacterium]MBQ7119771.1 hypothetical protein [Oscillospiraceae bacterium]